MLRYVYVIRELSFFTGRGAVCLGGTRIFGVVKGGDQNFLRVKEGGTKMFFSNFFAPCSSTLGGGPKFFREAKTGDQNVFPSAKRGTKFFSSQKTKRST